MQIEKKETVGCMRKYHSFYKLFDGSPIPNWNYNPNATIHSGIEIPYYDFNGNGKLDKANEKMWLDALIKQIQSNRSDLNKDQLSRLKYKRNKNDYLGKYPNKITSIDIVRVLNSGE